MIPEAKPAVVLLFRETDGSPSPLNPREIKRHMAKGPIFDRYRLMHHCAIGLLCAGLALGFFILPLIFLVSRLLKFGAFGSPFPVAQVVGACLGILSIVLMLTSAFLYLRAYLFKLKIVTALRLAEEFERIGIAAKQRFRQMNARKTKLQRTHRAKAEKQKRVTQLVKDAEREMAEVLQAAKERYEREEIAR